MSIPAPPFHESSDQELRSRVKLLGKLVGNVLLKHEKPEVFHAVESLRTGFIQLRKRDSEAKRKALIGLINGLEPDVISQVVRAFTLYFNLVNIAEEDYLHRLRRESVQPAGTCRLGRLVSPHPGRIQGPGHQRRGAAGSV